MIFDKVMGEGKLFKDKRLNCRNTRSVLVQKDLFTFEYGSPVAAYKYSNFTYALQLSKTTLATLFRNEYLRWFSVANMANNLIVLTGGDQLDNIKSAKTFMMEVKTGKWKQQSLPDLNLARSNHSSCCIDDHVYVACG